MGEKDQRTVYYGLYNFGVLLTLLAQYAGLVYPIVSPIFGGGKALEISMVIKAEQVPVIRALGFNITDERVTSPVKLILETPDSLLVLPPSQKNRAQKIKSLRIRRDAVDSVLYVEPTRP